MNIPKLRVAMPSSPRKKLLLSLVPTMIGLPIIALAAHAALHNSPKAVVDQAWQIVDRDYVDPKFNQIDWLQIRRSLLSHSYASPDDAYKALRDALSQLNDPYTRFMTPDEFQAFQHETDGTLVGVGLRLGSDPQTHALKVVSPIENSPASRAGIEAGDVIVAVDDQNVEGKEIDTVVNLIRGEANTQVKLTLKRQSVPLKVTLTRESIQVPTVEYSLQQDHQHRIGYIHLNEFSAHAADDVKHAILELEKQKADEFVLDLRDNPGGRLDQGIAIAQMWINDGNIVKTVDRHGKSEQFSANHTALTDLPLAVLVNGNSASASEILTGALKDNHRAVVVGTQTFGKALVQSVNPLADGSGLNVTIAHYFTPDGTDINHRGITPDQVVSLTDAQKQELLSHHEQVGTAQDPQFEQAVVSLKRKHS